MTDQHKIPEPKQQGESAGESLFERAAGKFDFNSFLGKPLPVSTEPPSRRFPVKPPEAQQVAPAPAPVPAPAPAPVAPPVAAPAPVPVAAPVAVPEPAIEPAIFHSEAHPVDREHLRAQGLIVPEGTVTELLEEFRIVKRQLLLQAADLRRQKAGPMAQRILVSSPHPGEGKTYCALNLALSIAAEKDSEVLLVDADFAKPSVLSALGLPGGPGLMDALMDEELDVADCVLSTDIPGLWVLPAGDTTSHDSEYIASSRTARVLDRLTQGSPNRMVIFDSPPALSASPAAELAKYVGQTMVIVRADKTGRGALNDAISLLGACPNVQLLLNAAQFSPSGRRFGSYYGYRG
ncbi:AAA family ATPase [Novosphingobium sp. P6W]|uniref:AAA family ATPase n=1 Tax=Novosphingobium sp. P6W TaxID=1609758 RepID=UPI0005C2D807|nr:AAA family ATPase [Novosphingobium sp. P6W]AXB76947.1 capsular biosynthesis protein [Novosphingobium sp. P6W]KIS33213.1 capsular biosynthesis protein [Novosphingobium sp. P6W]